MIGWRFEMMAFLKKMKSFFFCDLFFGLFSLLLFFLQNVFFRGSADSYWNFFGYYYPLLIGVSMIGGLWCGHRIELKHRLRIWEAALTLIIAGIIFFLTMGLQRPTAPISVWQDLNRSVVPTLGFMTSFLFSLLITGIVEKETPRKKRSVLPFAAKRIVANSFRFGLPMAAFIYVLQIWYVTMLSRGAYLAFSVWILYYIIAPVLLGRAVNRAFPASALRQKLPAVGISFLVTLAASYGVSIPMRTALAAVWYPVYGIGWLGEMFSRTDFLVTLFLVLMVLPALVYAGILFLTLLSARPRVVKHNADGVQVFPID